MNKHRKKLLLGVLGLIVIFYAGDWLLENLLEGPLEARRKTKASLEKNIQTQEESLARARKAGKQLSVWEEQSLPSNTEVASSTYQVWLLQVIQRAGLSAQGVNSSEPINKGMYSLLSFSARAHGSLEQLTRFLFEFYRAGHLHQLRSLSITPIQKTGELDLVISVEAMVLPSTDRDKEFATQISDRLASEKLEDYMSIVKRNLFDVGGGLDPTDQTVLTTVTYVDGKPEVWFLLRGTDELLKLKKGDRLEIGLFSGTLAEIEDTDVILESEGERWLLSIGENLTQATALPPEY
ncbi:MAG: hypothetical protein JXM70_09880 [Pirellulales bacterium]|nr:hypothetical protein [Pirellulales bacterium]